MYTLYSKDGKEVSVKTGADRDEYIASGFYSLEPFTTSGKQAEVKVEAVEDIEDAEIVEPEKKTTRRSASDK